MAIKHVDPISRIEGHLGVKCTTDANDYIIEADAHGNLWRGFENFLLGREPNDAITFTQRICGVCPVPHGQTATFAVEAALGYNNNFQTYAAGGNYSPKGLSANVVTKGLAADDRVSVGSKGIPTKAVLIRNLILSAEFLMSSITHQYHLAAPSYIQGPNIPPWTPYFADSYYHPLLLASTHGVAATTNANQPAQGGSTLPLDVAGFSKDLWSAVIKSYVHALRIRRLTFEAGAMFAGRMPMTSSFVAGGVSTKKDENLSAKCTKFRNLIAEVGAFIVQEYVPIFLALGALYPNFDNQTNAGVLATVTTPIQDSILGASPVSVNLWTVGNKDTAGPVSATNTRWGAGLGNFLSWGAFPQTNGYLGMTRGYKLGAGGTFTTINDSTDVPANLKEVITHSRYAKTFEYTAGDAQYPGIVSRTEPDRTAAGAAAGKYSWMKAPRYAGSAFEVGPMARMYLEGHFVAGSTLASTVPGFGAYTKGGGLDPVMVAPDIAVALVRTGLATLVVGATTYGVGATALPGTASAIAGAYYDPTAYIGGVIATWATSIVAGLSTMDRLRARALESLVLVQQMIGAVSKTATGVAFPAMGGWVGELNGATGGTYVDKPYPVAATFGWGATEAPRGALMHFCSQTAGKITKYQCVVPTTWNGSPKGLTTGDRGAIEAAIVGAKYAPTTNAATGGGGSAITVGGGVEALRIAQSFDPCIACAVH